MNYFSSIEALVPLIYSLLWCKKSMTNLYRASYCKTLVRR